MGRRKYHMHGKQHGRNMLICEYIWIAWKQQTLPPGAPAPPQYTMQEVKPCQCKPPKKPHRDDEQCWVKVKHDWYRERKQVSSHIQVIKNFFRFHPACELSSPISLCTLPYDTSLCSPFHSVANRSGRGVRDDCSHTIGVPDRRSQPHRSPWH